MRRIITCTVLSVLLAALLLGGNLYVGRTLDGMRRTLCDIRQFAESGEYQKAAGQCRRLEDMFRDSERPLSLFVKYDMLSEAGSAVYGLSGYACADNLPDLLVETDRALRRLEALRSFYFSVY